MLVMSGETLQFGDFTLHPQARVLRRQDQPVPLNRRAFDVLLYLVRNPGRPVSKEELLSAVWPESFVEENNLNQSISALRRAIEDRPGEHRYIATLSGRGYQFLAAVQHIPGDLEHPSPLALEAAPAPAREAQPTDALQSAGTHNTLTPHDSLTTAPPAAGLYLQRTVTTSIVTQQSQPASRLRPAILVLALVAVVAGSGYAWWRAHHPRPTSAAVVLADFLNTTGDPTFDRTLNRALEIDLSQSPYMDVMSERQVVEQLRLMDRSPDSPLTPELARQVCERNNRQAVLSGIIASVGTDYLLTLQATDCASGKQLASAKATAHSKERVVPSLDALADRVRSRLGESSSSRETYQIPIVQATTPSLEALKAYSIASSMEAQGHTEPELIPLYQRAVEMDPNFAMAYGALATQYYNLSEFMLASRYYRRAFELSSNVSSREKLIIQAHFYAEGQNDLEQGIRVYKLWAATYPREWTPWLDIANEYNQIGQYDLAIDAARHALDLEPNRAIVYSVLARALVHANRVDDAKALGQLAIARHKDSTGLHGTLYTLALQQHDQPAIDRELKWGIDSGDWYALYLRAYAAAAANGQRQLSRDLFQQAIDLTRRQGLTESADALLTDEAFCELWYGYPDQARDILRQITRPDQDLVEVAYLHAELGDLPEAERYLAAHSGPSTAGSPPPGTLMTYLYLPRLRATIDLTRNKPQDAVAALNPDRPYEMADYIYLSLHGRAYLQAHQPQQAATYFRTLLANPGIGYGALYPIAHLQLARALVMAGDPSAARSEYKAFLDAWINADPGLPILKAAQSEYAALR